MNLNLNIIQHIDAFEGLKQLPDECVHTCVTSPPYWNLRDYKVKGQIGLEKTPEQYISKMVEVFHEVKRVLRKDGTCWINIGDSYASAAKNRTVKQAQAKSTLEGRKNGELLTQQSKITGDFKTKNLIGISWMLAFALRADGWYLRQDIIWNKPNPMPESVKDRCTKSHEYIFLLSKSKKYYFDGDAIKSPVKDSTVLRMMQQVENQKGSITPGKTNGPMKAVGPGRKPRIGIDNKGGNQASLTGIKAYSHRGVGDQKITGHSGNLDADGNLIGDGMANKRSVWTICTASYKEAHFATFPEELPYTCILAGCPENGIVLDPFAGAGTTGLIARKLNRNFIGFELNGDYVKMANNRLEKKLGMFK